MKTLLKVSLIAAAFLLLPVSSSFAHGYYGNYSSGHYCPSSNFGFSYGYPQYNSYNPYPYYYSPYSYYTPYNSYYNYSRPYYRNYRSYNGYRNYGYRNDYYRNNYRHGHSNGYYGGGYRSHHYYPRVQKSRYSTPRQGAPVVRRR